MDPSHLYDSRSSEKKYNADLKSGLVYYSDHCPLSSIQIFITSLDCVMYKKLSYQHKMV